MAHRSRAKKVAMSDQEDRLSTLPDGVLQHVLGFLPAHEVVRTSVHAPRWRHVWRSVRRLHITCPVGGTCSHCRGDDNHKGRCVHIGGLSSAVNLKLTAHSGKFLFRRDLNLCPTFSKLKKLLLNDWCVAVDLGALVCILKHSPALENLTLQLRKGPKLTTQVEGNNISVEKSAVLSESLKTIKIECEEVDDRVCKLVKFLYQLDIEVAIKRTKI